jgi:magnesium chelatase family protein
MGHQANHEIKGYASVLAAQPIGASAALVKIEADITLGLHSFSIIGLPNKAVEESKDRISAAIRHAGFKSPKMNNRRIVLSLSPADIRKEGSHYDVPLALCYLAAVGEIQLDETPALFAGELGLDGVLRSSRGILPQVIAAKNAGITTVFVPPGNSQESLLVENITVYAPKSLKDLILHIQGTHLLEKETRRIMRIAPPSATNLSEIKGQESAKRALEIAAAGRHNLVLYGPPGTGKTMLARALPGILPQLTSAESLAVTAIHSTSGTLKDEGVIHWPPFRSPHHTVSHTAMVGGGNIPRPGEITLAHHGVLFLDEFTEFQAQTLEALRQPLEDREVTISRARASFTFPADCMIVAAMNPGDTLFADERLQLAASRKQSQKISSPIIDRLDVWVEVPHISIEELSNLRGEESSEVVRNRVSMAREFAQARNGPGTTNARLSIQDMENLGHFSDSAKIVLSEGAQKLSLSPRSYHRTMRVARTIADLEGSEMVGEAEVLEALQYRPTRLLGHERD